MSKVSYKLKFIFLVILSNLFNKFTASIVATMMLLLAAILTLGYIFPSSPKPDLSSISIANCKVINVIDLTNKRYEVKCYRDWETDRKSVV